MPLSKDEALALLKEDENKPKRGGGGRTKADPTAVRELHVWMKLNHYIRETGCENPDCVDPRPRTDKGTNIVAQVKDKLICRYCFMKGYLL